MADYGVNGQGASLRDALNALYPMTGLGNYSTGFAPAMFPPQTGSEMPSGPVPMPRPRPQPQVNPNLPPPGAALAAGPPLAGAPGAPPPPLQANLGLAGPSSAPMVSGGLNYPLGDNLMAFMGGNFARPGYGARLGLAGRF